MSHKKKDSHAGEWATLGAAAAALAAASYYFFGPGGDAHRKKARGWMIKMKGEVVHRLEGLTEVTESAYHDVIDTVAEEYERAKIASQEEIASAVDDMKEAWGTILLEHGSANRDGDSDDDKNDD